MLRKTSIKIATGARQPAIKITPRVPSSPSAPPGTASTAAPPGTIQQILPEHVGYSPWNTRHPSAFKDDEFCRLQADISSARGNTIPIKVRRRRPSPAWFNTSQKIETYEVVYGHRRHQACLQLGIPVLAVVEDLDDHHLVAEMLTENDNRKTLSAWELGDLFRLMLDRGLYPTQTALARALARDEGDVSRALRVRAIPTEILSAVDTPTGFALHDGDRLSRALKADQAAVLHTARDLVEAGTQVTAKKFMQLIAKKAEGKPKCSCDEIGASNAEDVTELESAGGRKTGFFRWHDDGTLTIRIKEPIAPENQLRLVELFAAAVRAILPR